jgi:hypothetical protein
MGKQTEIPRPSPSNCKPPGSPTGFAHTGCYARKLNDCSTDMSGEHLFSEVTLNLVAGPDGNVSRIGYPWQEEGQIQTLRPANCKANVLCKRHNNALSPLDTAAGRFLKAIVNTPGFLQNHDLRVLILSGDDIERWILKTLCTHIVVVRRFGSDWEPPLEWLEILWSMKSFAAGCGMYFNQDVGKASPDAVQLGLRVLTSPTIDGASGGIIQLCGYQFALAMVAPTLQQTPDSVLVPKYYRPSDFIISYGKSEVVYSLGWADPVVPRRVGISWSPSV